MAVGPSKSETFTDAGTMLLGEAAPGRVGRWAVHIQGSGWTGAVTPKAAVGDQTAIAIAFYDVVAGAMATEAPSADGVILVESSGLDVELGVTATAGSVTIEAVPIVG